MSLRENIKTLVRTSAPNLFALRKATKLLYKPNSYLIETGFLASYARNYPCEQDGSPLPWMNYAIIEILKERLNQDISVFEWGSGYSTKFFAARVKNIVSIEYDRKWFDLIEKELKTDFDNTKLIHKSLDYNGAYCRAIEDQDKKFNLVVVDGRDRVRCAEKSLPKLTDDGIIIFDDTWRPHYQDGLAFYRNAGFKVLNLTGLIPTGFGRGITSIIYRENNCLGL